MLLVNDRWLLLPHRSAVLLGNRTKGRLFPVSAPICAHREAENRGTIQMLDDVDILQIPPCCLSSHKINMEDVRRDLTLEITACKAL